MITTIIKYFALLAIISITADAFFGYPDARDNSHHKKKPKKSRDEDVVLEKLEQRLDNFDPQNFDTFRQRYYRNDDFFTDGGPIFIYVGGEWEIEPDWVQGGYTYDLAEKYNGQLFYPEHRYYGKSKPTEDTSTENLRYLSTDQALADLAHFIAHVKREPGKENSKVILVGGSYAGTMVTWFRQKYPHLVAGVWASSAPVHAQLDLYQYKEVSGKAYLDLAGSDCYNMIKEAFHEAEQLIANRDYNRFSNLFSLCEEFDGSNYYDVGAVFCLLSDILTSYVQYHSEGDLTNICDEISAVDKPNNLEKFAKWFTDYMSDGDKYCIEADYMATIKYFRHKKWRTETVKGGDRQWIYQTCAEFGYYQTSDSKYQPFGSTFPLDLFTRACEDIFGETFNNASIEYNIDRTNVVYGGFNPNIENIFFTQGSIDPWHVTGINEDLNPLATAYVIANASHCQDLYSISDDDSHGILEAKYRVDKLVRQWLGISDTNNNNDSN